MSLPQEQDINLWILRENLKFTLEDRIFKEKEMVDLIEELQQIVEEAPRKGASSLP